MRNIAEYLKNLATLEWHIYTLECMNRDIDQFCPPPTLIPMPQKPAQPRGAVIKDYPVYDEKEYAKKVKEGGGVKWTSNLSGCLFQLGLTLCGTVIGLVFGILLLIAGVFSLPLSVGAQRREGRKIYEEECRQIDEENRAYKDVVQRYNHQMAIYQQDMQKWEAQQRGQYANDSIKSEFERRITYALKTLCDIRQKVYGIIKIPEKYRNPVAMQMFCLYFDQQGATTLEDAMNLFEIDLSRGNIIIDVAEARKFKTIMSRQMPTVMRALEDSDNKLKNMSEQFRRWASSIKNTSDLTHMGTETTLGVYLQKIVIEGKQILNIFEYEVKT